MARVFPLSAACSYQAPRESEVSRHPDALLVHVAEPELRRRDAGLRGLLEQLGRQGRFAGRVRPSASAAGELVDRGSVAALRRPNQSGGRPGRKIGRHDALDAPDRRGSEARHMDGIEQVERRFARRLA